MSIFKVNRFFHYIPGYTNMMPKMYASFQSKEPQPNSPNSVVTVCVCVYLFLYFLYLSLVLLLTVVVGILARALLVPALVVRAQLLNLLRARDRASWHLWGCGNKDTQNLLVSDNIGFDISTTFLSQILK